MRASFVLCSTVCLIAWLGFAAASAEIYKWIDEEGRVHYGDKPMGGTAEQLKLREQPSADDNAETRRAKRDRLLEIFDEQRAEREALAAKQRAEREERRLRCEEAKRRQQKYETASAIFEKDDNGNRRILSDEEHAMVRRVSAEEVQRWCSDG
jgi:hypothetical protein